MKVDQNEILKKEKQYLKAIHAARIGHWELDLNNRIINYIDDSAGIYGWDVELFRRLDGFMEHVVAEDRPKVEAALRKGAHPGGSYQTEFRMLWPDGSVHWLMATGSTILDPETGTLLMSGVNLDISEHKQTETQLGEVELQLAATFNQAAVGIANVGIDGSLVRVNSKFAQITGYSIKELSTKTFQDITHPDDLSTDLELVNQILEGDISNYSMEKRYIRKDGSVVWVNLTVSLVKHLDGTPSYFISVIEDISEMKEDQLAIRELTNELELRVKSRTKELEEINHELEQFLFITSHNLREPVLRIRQTIKLLQTKIQFLLDAVSNRYMVDIIESSTKLNQTVQSLLGFSRVKRGNVTFSFFNLNEAITIALDSLPTVRVKQQDLGEVYGNKVLLVQFFNVLLENLLKMTNKTLVLNMSKSSKKNKSVYEILIQDEKLQPEELEKLFSLSSNEATEQKLDLVLCKTIIEKHNGKIWVERDTDGGMKILFTVETRPSSRSQLFR